MKAYWDSLRPMEKRLIVGVGVVLFFVLNSLFIVPHFSDLGLIAQKKIKAQQNLAKYQLEIAQMPFYQRELARMSGEGQDVLPEDQANVFRDTVIMQATRSGSALTGQTKPVTRTNQFFLKLSMVVSVESTEQQLVNLLYSLGNEASQMRVRDLTMRPDAPHYKLNANVTLEASYQKKTAAKTATPALKTSGPPPRPGSGNATAAR